MDIGRWTGEDPLKFGAGDFNLYRYVHNSPTNATDPSGLIDPAQWFVDWIGVDNVRSWDNVLGDVRTGGFARFSNFAAGMGDTITLGLTSRVRQGLGYDDVVDYSSGAYALGTNAGQIVNIGLMMVNPYAGAAWAQKAFAGINTLAAVGGVIGAGEAALSGDFGAAALMLGGAALRRAGNGCASWGNFGLGAFATATTAAGGIDRILAGDYIGGALDLITAGVSARRMFSCFTGEMLIDCEGGKRRADSIQVGDRLWSRSEFDATGPIELKEVEEVFIRVAPVINVHVGGQIIRTTREHPFWVEGKGW